MSPITSTLANGSAYGYRTLAGAAGGSYESIATATPNGVSSVTFSSIPSTYKHLQVRVMCKSEATGAFAVSLVGTFNSDSGANYVWHKLQGDGSSATSENGTGQTWTLFTNAGLQNDASLNNMFGVAIIDIADYASTTKFKTVRSFNGVNANSTSTNYRISLESNLWRDTAAINNISFSPLGSTFLAGTVISLYGIKG
jgi:hypothetical protein